MYRQPPLPYAYSALAPAISAQTVERHYTDNHAGYYRKLNDLVKGTPWMGRPVEEIAIRSDLYTPLNNNAAQAWAHDFWWRSMQPASSVAPQWVGGKDFESIWISRGVALFGSGWLWLTLDSEGKLGVEALPDAVLPQQQGLRPILVMDLWEHAYYCQYGTKRADYLKNTIKHLNWKEAERRLRGD